MTTKKGPCNRGAALDAFDNVVTKIEGATESTVNQTARLISLGRRDASTDSERFRKQWITKAFALVSKKETSACALLIALGVLEIIKEFTENFGEDAGGEELRAFFRVVEAHFPDGVPDDWKKSGSAMYKYFENQEDAEDLFGDMLVRKRHPVHVLLVELTFSSCRDRETWTEDWSRLARRVRSNEPRCLTYDMSVDVSNPRRCIIYERYVSKDDLEGPHQKSIAVHRSISSCTVKPLAVKFSHFKGTGIGHA